MARQKWERQEPEGAGRSDIPEMEGVPRPGPVENKTGDLAARLEQEGTEAPKRDYDAELADLKRQVEKLKGEKEILQGKAQDLLTADAAFVLDKQHEEWKKFHGLSAERRTQLIAAKRYPGEPTYRVSVPDNPVVDLPAHSEAEAKGLYMSLCGITSCPPGQPVAVPLEEIEGTPQHERKYASGPPRQLPANPAALHAGDDAREYAGRR